MQLSAEAQLEGSYAGAAQRKERSEEMGLEEEQRWQIKVNSRCAEYADLIDRRRHDMRDGHSDIMLDDRLPNDRQERLRILSGLVQSDSRHGGQLLHTTGNALRHGVECISRHDVPGSAILHIGDLRTR